jgi:predicted nucleotidyltransferase
MHLLLSRSIIMVKPLPPREVREVRYDEKRWKILREKREKAMKPMKILASVGMEPIVHGSIARGDVNEKSDIDIFIPFQVQPFRVEMALRDGSYEPFKREIVIATPWQLPKAHLYLDDELTVSFPLLRPLPTELDFYRFGGALGVDGIEKGERVAGVDKRLMLIEPTPYGHVESSVLGREGEVAKKLGVDVAVVRERIQVLTRRAEIGHTGLYFRRELAPNESFEGVIPEVERKVRWSCRR